MAASALFWHSLGCKHDLQAEMKVETYFLNAEE